MDGVPSKGSWAHRATASGLAGMGGWIHHRGRRNRVYATEEAIWSATVSDRQENYRARNNLGYVLSKKPGRLDDAIAQYQVKPDSAEAHFSLAVGLLNVPGRRR